MRLCLPPALTHRGTTVKLGVHFEWRTGAPVRPYPLALQPNSEDGVIRMLPGGCQLVLGRADRVASWRVDACPCQAPMQHLPSTDICCIRKKNCVEFFCGCILILLLCSLSLAERTGSSARLACINCPCLARCLFLIILINFNSPGSHCHSSCSFKKKIQLHRLIPTCILGQAWMHISMSTTLRLFSRCEKVSVY